MHYRFNGFSPKASILKEKQSMKNGRVCCHYPSHKFIDKILGGGRFPSLRRNEFSSGGSFTSKQGWEIVLSFRRCNVEFIEKFLWTFVAFFQSIQLWYNWMYPGSVLPLQRCLIFSSVETPWKFPSTNKSFSFVSIFHRTLRQSILGIFVFKHIAFPVIEMWFYKILCNSIYFIAWCQNCIFIRILFVKKYKNTDSFPHSSPPPYP